MNFPFHLHPFLWLDLLLALNSGLVAGLAWRRRQAAAAKPLALLMLTNAIISFVYALLAEALLLDHTTRFLFWERIASLLMPLWLLALFCFTVELTGHQPWLQAKVLLPLATLLLILPVTLLFDRFLIFVDLAQEQPTTLAWFLFLPYLLVVGLILYLTLQPQFKLDSTHRRQFGPLLPPIWALLISFLLFSSLPYPTGWSLSHLLMVLLDGFASLCLLIAILRFGLLAYLPYYSSLTFQRMPAAGIVLDHQQRIVALNPAIICTLGSMFLCRIRLKIK